MRCSELNDQRSFSTSSVSASLLSTGCVTRPVCRAKDIYLLFINQKNMPVGFTKSLIANIPTIHSNLSVGEVFELPWHISYSRNIPLILSPTNFFICPIFH